MRLTGPLATAVGDSLDHCVKCTVCESACPVAAVTPLFPGPKTVGPQAERFRGAAGPAPDASVDYCSGCGVCTRVCPHGVRVAEINAQARARLRRSRPASLRDQLLARPALAGRLGRPVAPLYNWALRSGRVRALTERLIGIDRAAPLPPVARRTFSSQARRRVGAEGAERVVYFHGCSADSFEPRVGRMTVAILEHHGFEVRVPEQGCCGLPLQSNGLFGPARRAVRRLARALTPAGTEGLPIIASSTSCGLMVKREAREVLGIDDPRLRDVGHRTYDLFEFLAQLHRAGRLRTDFATLPLTVAYYAPCQQRSQGIGSPALDILALVPGLRLIELDRDCCGIAGTYGLKREKHGIAMAVGRPLFDDIAAAQPDLVACDSETCRWQIGQATGVAAVHPLEVLYWAYGGR